MDAQILRLAGKVSHESIKITYEGESLNEKRAEFVAISAEYADISEKKKEAMQDFKDAMKPIELEKKRLLDITRKGYELVHKEVKLLANDQDGTIEFYDLNSGEFLGHRNQYPNERIAISVLQD